MSFFNTSDESSLRDVIAKWLHEQHPEKTEMLLTQHPSAIVVIAQGMSVCAIQNGNLLADAFVPEEASLDENGCIPAHTTCPFKTRCEIASCCNHQGVLHDKPYSCSAARSFR